MELQMYETYPLMSRYDWIKNPIFQTLHGSKEGGDGKKKKKFTYVKTNDRQGYSTIKIWFVSIESK